MNMGLGNAVITGDLREWFAGMAEVRACLDVRKVARGESCISEHSEGFHGADFKNSINNPNIALKTQVEGRG